MRAQGDVGAKEARLSIMVGAEREAFDGVKPLFELMGKNIRLMGPAGAGQHTKMVNQILIATNMIGCVEGKPAVCSGNCCGPLQLM